MWVLKENFYIQIEEKGSKFLCFLEIVNSQEDVKNRQNQLREMHPKSVHVVYASRILNNFLQIDENQSDDGEPKGSSGPSILNVLRGADLVNAGCFVVRYFGGTLLGVGGLVRVYSRACNMALELAKDKNGFDKFIFKSKFILKVDYFLDGKLSYFLDKFNIEYTKKFSEIIEFQLFLSKEDEKILNPFLNELGLKLFMLQ